MTFCFAVAIAVVLILVLFLLFLKNGKKRIYKPKGDFLLSAEEKRFFDALRKSIAPDMYICPKVRIADLVTMALDSKDKDYWANLNKITGKHVDFVVCDKNTFEPLFIIELDGGSHNDKARELRDMLVDDVFEDADIPMIHVKTSATYNVDILTEEINRAINKT